MSTEVAIGLLSAATTIIAALIQRSWSLTRRRLPKHEPIEYGAVHEGASFSVRDVVKALDLSKSGAQNSGQPGRAVLTDSYLVRRESDSGNGMIFRYASNGALEGRCLSHTDNHVVGTYESTHFKSSRMISVLLGDLAERNSARVTNQMTYTGAFDRADGEDFETHVERPTSSLTIIITFSPKNPCRSVIGQTQIGERGHTETALRDGPLVAGDGTLLYWHIVPKKGEWLPIGAKYRLQWTWGRASLKAAGMVS